MSKAKRTATAVRFPAEVHERLKRESERFGLPINFLVVKAVEEMLDNLISPDELRLTRRRDRVESPGDGTDF